MSTTGFPWIENLKQIRDVVTNETFVCTAKELDLPYEWRTSIVNAPGREGGFNALSGGRAYLGPRTVAATLIKVYTGNDTWKSVMHDLESVLNPGNELELTFVEEDGSVWYWFHVLCSRFDKRETLTWRGYCEIPLTFVCPDPRQRAQYKPGVPLLDTGLFLDDPTSANAWLLDTDPDAFPITAGTTPHDITNPSSAADEAPIATLHGPMTIALGVTYIYFIYDDQFGNRNYWAYTRNIAAGETVTVDAEQLTVVSSDTTVDAYGSFVVPTNQDSWGRIAVGLNHIYVVCATFGAGAAATVGWVPRK